MGARAAQAAQAALGCQLSDAGPEAARRAAEAGVRALQASQGLTGLGGLDDVKAKLQRCVRLPLLVRCSWLWEKLACLHAAVSLSPDALSCHAWVSYDMPGSAMRRLIGTWPCWLPAGRLSQICLGPE